MKKHRSGFLFPIKFIAGFTILLSVLFSCEKPDTEYVLSDRSMIISMMKDSRAAMKSPGWIVGVNTPSARHEYAGGEADPGQGIPMQSDELIRIGSVTKTFTATLALMLCEDGLLSLDEKLEEYFPEFPQSGEITIRQLLKHTSGITTWDEDEEIRMQIYHGTGEWNIDKLIAWAAQQPLLADPGEEFHYSNIGYFLVGKILELKTGKSIDELLQAKICQPLGFSHTFMPDEPYPAGDIIHGFDESGGTVEDMTGTSQAMAINFDLAWTAGGLMTTLEELTIWSKVLATGELLSDSMHLAQMPALHPPSASVPYYSGYGMGVSQTDVWIGHTGAICGFVCNMQYYPLQDVSIITFFNKFSAFDTTANAADLKVMGENFAQVARYICPGTLDPGK